MTSLPSNQEIFKRLHFALAVAEKHSDKDKEIILLCSCGFGPLRGFSITMQGDGLLDMDTDSGRVVCPAALCSFLLQSAPLETGQSRRIIGFGGK